MPFKKEFQVTHIFNSEDNRVKYAKPGENIRVIKKFKKIHVFFRLKLKILKKKI